MVHVAKKVFSYFGNQQKTFGDLSCCFRYRSTLSGIVGFSIPYFSSSFLLFIFEKRTDRLGSKGGGICVYRTAMRELGPNRHQSSRIIRDKERKKKEEENKLDTSCYIYVAKKGKGGALIPPGIEIRQVLRGNLEREVKRQRNNRGVRRNTFLSGAKSFKSLQ